MSCATDGCSVDACHSDPSLLRTRSYVLAAVPGMSMVIDCVEALPLRMTHVRLPFAAFTYALAMTSVLPATVKFAGTYTLTANASYLAWQVKADGTNPNHDYFRGSALDTSSGITLAATADTAPIVDADVDPEHRNLYGLQLADDGRGVFALYMKQTAAGDTIGAARRISLDGTSNTVVTLPADLRLQDLHGYAMWTDGEGKTMLATVLLLVAVIGAYSKFGHGVEFFPSVEPDYGQVIVHGRGNIALDEKDAALRQVEKTVLATKGLKTVYTRVGEQPQGSNEITEDTIGVIQFEFADWQTRPAAHVIMDEIREKTRHIPGILVEVTAPRAGPPTGKPIQVQLSALDPAKLPAAAKKVAGILSQMPAVRDLDDGLPLPGIDWKLEVDKAEAAKYGANVNSVGTAVQLVTNGVKVTEYRPSDTDKAVDIIVRFPKERRSLSQIDELRVQTPSGSVPIGNFVKRVPAQRVGYINRVNAQRVMTVSSNIAEGVQSAVVQQDITEKLSHADLGDGVTFKLKGEDEERAKAGAFLGKAFGTALFLIFAILLAQFNRFISVGLVLSAVLLSTIGVLLGLLIMGQPFGVVMTGIGIIANAGVIVNNNIVLIDTYDRLRREGQDAYEAILETCRERARPVVLTAVTAILGVLPIAFGINLDFISREITHGAPATQWWISLSTSIVFGLGFATVLTLVVTPAALMGIANLAARREAWRTRRRNKRLPKAAVPAE